MGISMLFEEVRTTGLDITVVSGKRITEVESCRVSEDRLGVGVGSMEIDVVVSDGSTTELLSGTICELVSTTGVVSEVVGCSEALGETNIEVSGIRKPEVLSGVGAKLVSTGVRSEVVGCSEALGETNIEVSGIRKPEVLSGVVAKLVSTGVRSEVVGCSEALGETNIEVSGIRKPEVLSGVVAKLVSTGVRSEVVGMNETLGEKMEGETIDEGRSSMLDCMENDREGAGEKLGRTDSVRTGSEVRRDCTENITDITGTDVI